MGRFFRNLLHHIVPTRGNAYRPRLLTGPWLLFFLTIVLTVEGVFLASTQVPLAGRLLPAAVVESEVVVLTNSQRAQYGAETLTENILLTLAAQSKAEDMASRGYFSHVSPDGTEPWAWLKQAGYVYQYAGENLAVRFDDSSAVVGAWMASPSHRENIVKPEYTHIGIGIAQGLYDGSPVTFVVQYFGTPLARAEVTTQAGAPARQIVAEVESGAGAIEDVAGAVASAVPSAAVPNVTQTTVQQFLRAVAGNPTSTALALGAVAAIVALVVVLGFGMHIQVQPVEMLFGGSLVVAIALFFVMFNGQIVGVSNFAQEAALGSLAEPRGIIGEGISTKMPIVQ